jgi:hypothetical protein
MAYRRSVAAALVAATFLGGAAYAAEQAARPAATQETPAQKAIDQDVGKLSKDGAQAFRDMHLARIAIFDADPAQAKSLIGKAQAALAKAKTDDAVFTRAEADLRTQSDMAAPKDTATSDKTAAQPAAKDTASKGDQKGAIEKLKLAHVDVNFVMAVLPLDKTTADVNQAATLIGQGKYYEANAALKTAEDGMRFDVIDAVGLPQKAAAHTAAKPASQGNAGTTDGKTAK